MRHMRSLKVLAALSLIAEAVGALAILWRADAH